MATIADVSVLAAASATSSNDEGSRGVRVAGWHVSTRHGEVLSDSRRIELAKDLCAAAGCEVEAPARLKSSEIVLHHEASGFRLRFATEPALMAWARAQAHDGGESGLVQMAARTRGDVSAAEGHDWTFFTNWGGDAGTAVEAPLEASGIDKALLADKLAPILLFDDVLLVDDALQDRGAVSLSAKVRVMPSCVFVLLRCFVRVDGIGIKVAESRVFHAFGNGRVCRDRSERCALWHDLAARGLPADPAQLLDPGAVVGSLPLLGEARSFAWDLAASEATASGAAAVPREEATHEAAAVAQVEFYFSDANLPGDKFLQNELAEGGDGMVALSVIARFNKMKKLFRKMDPDYANGGRAPLAALAAALGTSANLLMNEDGTRVGRRTSIPEADKDDLMMRTVRVHCLPAASTIESVREAFSKCGAVRTVRMPSPGGSVGVADETLGPARAGAAFAEVEFCEASSALAACEALTDTQNWRGGVRVTLSNGMAIPAARKVLAKAAATGKHATPKAKPPKAVPNAVKQPATPGAAEDEGAPPATTTLTATAAAMATSETGISTAPATSDAPSARGRGVVDVIKGPYGFIVPSGGGVKGAQGGGKTRECNLYFATSKALTLRRGDAVAYDLAIDPRSGRPTATNVDLVGGAPLAEAAGAPAGTPGRANDAQAADEAPSGSAARPEAYKSRLQTQAYRMAKGPDKTIGFVEGWRAGEVGRNG